MMTISSHVGDVTCLNYCLRSWIGSSCKAYNVYHYASCCSYCNRPVRLLATAFYAAQRHCSNCRTFSGQSV